MKIQTIFIILILNSITTIKNICIQGENCPIGHGTCQKDSCVCLYNYWSLANKENPSSTIYCNYKKYNRFFVLIIEFFLPSIGHLISGKYYFFIIKFLLLFVPIIYFICGFCIFKKNNETYNNLGVWQPTREEGNNDYNNTLDEELHRANRENIKIGNSTKFPVFLSFLFLIGFFIMHVIDLFCYAFGLYYDGKGVPYA